MPIVSRRTFAKTAAACAVMLEAPKLFANPLGLPIGLQLYSVRDFLPKDFAGTLQQLGAMGYQEVEAAGFYNHSAAEVKQAMDAARLHCVSAHYPMPSLQSHLDDTIRFASELGLSFMICSSPMMKDPSRAKGLSWVQGIEAMTIDDWKWNADQLNGIGKQTQAAGIQLGYHNHFLEFHPKGGGVRPYDILLENTDPKLVTMEMDCGWVVIGGAKPEDYLRRHPTRFTQLHIKEFKLEGWTPGKEPVSTEMNQGSIDYKSVFAAAKHANVRHIYVEQEAFPDMPAMQALKVDADWLRAFPG